MSLPEPTPDVAPDVGAAAESSPAATPTPQTALTGRIWVAVAAIMWSSSGLFAKAPTFEAWPRDSRGILLAFWRALFAGVLLIPFVRQPRWDIRLVPFCLTFAVMNVMYLNAMTLTTAANAIWLQSTAPWWVFVIGLVFLREPFSPLERIPLLVGGVGMAIILVFEIQGQDRAGVLCGLVSGLSYAGVVLSLRALRGQDTVWLVVVSHLATAAMMLPYVMLLDTWPAGIQWPVLAGFGLFQMALPYVFFGRGLRSITSQEATAIGLLEPLLLPVWVYLTWGEAPAPWTMVGGGLIFLGLVLRYLLPRFTR